MPIETSAAWLFTLTLHACVLLAAAWIADRLWLRSRPAWRELAWRTALFGAIATASAQIAFDMPWPARVALEPAQASAHSRDASSGSASATSVAPSKKAVLAPQHESDRPREGVTAQTALSLTIAKPLGASAETGAQISAHASTRSKLTIAPAWAQLVLAAWLAGCAVALMRLFGSWLRLRALLGSAEPLDDARLAADAGALAALAEVRAPRLSVLDDLASPMAASGHCIVLPRWALELLDRDQLHAMLAHETAHLRRRDPAWKLAAAAAGALLWFVPTAALARRRLDELAELACDAWAAHHLGEGRALAECIAECAEHRHGAFAPALAPAMASRGSPLLQRIDHLLEGTAVNTSLPRARASAVAVAALALAAFALPGFVAQASPPAPPSAPAPPAPPAPPKAKVGDESHVHISSNVDLGGKSHDYTQVEVSRDGHSYAAKIKGKIVFTDDEDDVASLGDGGSASFSETKGDVERRIDYRSRGGQIERRYFVDDREQPIDAAAHAWIATLLPTVIRETAAGAEARVKRMYAKGGAASVLDEIGRIDSDYARGVYIKQLVAAGPLKAGDVTRALQLIDEFGSDYERRNALAAIANAAPLDASQQKLVVGQAEKIGSDYERAELLVGMLPTLAPDPALHAAWLRAASQIGSDYEHRRVLGALLEKQPVDDATLTDIIDGANAIGSDYERRELLVAAIHRIGDADRVADAYARATTGIGSDYERREALLALIRAPKFGAAGSRAVLEAANSIGSDFECREVLVALATVMPNDADLIARYRDVARRLSDYERGTAERALDRFARG